MVEDVWEIGVRVEGGVFTKDGLVKCLRLVLVEEKGKRSRNKARPWDWCIHEGYSIVRSKNQFGNRLCTQGWCLSLSLLQIIWILLICFYFIHFERVMTDPWIGYLCRHCGWRWDEKRHLWWTKEASNNRLIFWGEGITNKPKFQYHTSNN